jgi:hypothetical protein
MATTQLPNITIDLNDYVGEFADDYDMDAVHADYASALEALLPEGVHITRYGDVFADVAVLDQLREIDLDEVRERIDIEAILGRNER